MRLVPLAGLVLAWSVHAQTTVTIDHHAKGTPRFEFPVVPSPSSEDAARRAEVTLVAGTLDANSAPLQSLIDGKLPTDSDQPSANAFVQADTWGGRVRFDFHEVIDVARIHTYSWHPGSRGPQLYKVYGADGTAASFDAAPSNALDPANAGWTPIAFVDTRPKEGEGGGQYAVAISDSRGAALGRYRYLLFDVFETESDDAWGNTFYSEIDVIELPAMASRIREAIPESWNAYVTYAWGFDELQPLSRKGKNRHAASLLMTPVDTLDTLLLNSEYLLKGWLLFGDEDCRRMWETSVRALNAHLADETPSGLWYGQVDMNTGARMATELGALHAFLPPS